MNALITVKGTVQGVFFRQSAVEVASKLRLKGYVRNLHDGNVEILAQGTNEDINKLLQWCQHGPPHAKVDDVQVKFSDQDKKYVDFQIKR